MHTAVLSFATGDYFLSELIASQDDHHRTLVAEVCVCVAESIVCVYSCAAGGWSCRGVDECEH